MSYSKIAFSKAAQALQEKMGSRVNYARMEKHEQTEWLTNSEIDFISQRDSFYMATVGDNGFPYIQFRGGPKGFLKAIDKNKLGFIDFRGNMQYISAGNLATDNKVAIILLDYPSRTRLKIYAEAEVVALKDNPGLFNTLTLKDYRFRPEQMVVLNIKAYNWNCPQHITPRYTLEEIEEAFESEHSYITKLEEEIKSLRSKIAKREF